MPVCSERPLTVGMFLIGCHHALEDDCDIQIGIVPQAPDLGSDEKKETADCQLFNLAFLFTIKQRFLPDIVSQK